MAKEEKVDGRANNKGTPLPPGEKKNALVFYVKDKNREKIKEKVSPIIKKLDK